MMLGERRFHGATYLPRGKLKQLLLLVLAVVVLILVALFVKWLFFSSRHLPFRYGRRGPVLPPLKMRESAWKRKLQLLDERKLVPYFDEWKERWEKFEVNTLRPGYMPETIGVIGPTPEDYEEPETEDDYLKNTRFNMHMDARWGKKKVSRNLQKMKTALRAIFQGWSRFCEEHDLIYWLAHGTLLGWSWNQLNLPWDVDIDVQTTLHELTSKMWDLNQTVHEERFFFDVNPHLINRNYQTGTNKIDARYIDMRTGLYIDITALAYNASNDLYQCKSIHYHTKQELFPLQQTLYENVTTWIPNNVSALLEREYGKRVALPVFRVWRSDSTWFFHPIQEKWIKTSKIEAMKFLEYFASHPLPIKNPNPSENATELMDFFLYKK